MTTTPTTRRMAALRMNGVAGVRRAANRQQLLDENGEPIDGWAVMRSDGTPVDLDSLHTLTAEARAGKAEAELVVARARIETLKAAAAPATKSAAFERIEKAAHDLRGTDATLTREQAIDRVYSEQPELVAQYRAAPEDPAPASVAKAEVPGHGFAEAIGVRAMAVAKADGVSMSDAYDRVLASSEGQRLRESYYAANGR
jgi:hypothetical protein